MTFIIRGCGWRISSRPGRAATLDPRLHALISAICRLRCSTSARIVVRRRCSSARTWRRFYNNRSRGACRSATHDRTGHTAHGGSDWPTYDGSRYGAPAAPVKAPLSSAEAVVETARSAAPATAKTESLIVNSYSLTSEKRTRGFQVRRAGS